MSEPPWSWIVSFKKSWTTCPLSKKRTSWPMNLENSDARKVPRSLPDFPGLPGTPVPCQFWRESWWASTRGPVSDHTLNSVAPQGEALHLLETGVSTAASLSGGTALSSVTRFHCRRVLNCSVVSEAATKFALGFRQLWAFSMFTSRHLKMCSGAGVKTRYWYLGPRRQQLMKLPWPAGALGLQRFSCREACLHDPGINYSKAMLIFNVVTQPMLTMGAEQKNIIKIQRRGQKEGRAISGKKQRGSWVLPGKQLCASFLSKSYVIYTLIFK